MAAPPASNADHSPGQTPGRVRSHQCLHGLAPSATALIPDARAARRHPLFPARQRIGRRCGNSWRQRANIREATCGVVRSRRVVMRPSDGRCRTVCGPRACGTPARPRPVPRSVSRSAKRQVTGLPPRDGVGSTTATNAPGPGVDQRAYAVGHDRRGRPPPIPICLRAPALAIKHQVDAPLNADFFAQRTGSPARPWPADDRLRSRDSFDEESKDMRPGVRGRAGRFVAGMPMPPGVARQRRGSGSATTARMGAESVDRPVPGGAPADSPGPGGAKPGSQRARELARRFRADIATGLELRRRSRPSSNPSSPGAWALSGSRLLIRHSAMNAKVSPTSAIQRQNGHKRLIVGRRTP